MSGTFIDQLLAARDPRAGATLLLACPDDLLCGPMAMEARYCCARAGFPGALVDYLDLRVSALRAVRGPDGRLPDWLARMLEEHREALARFADGRQP